SPPAPAQGPVPRPASPRLSPGALPMHRITIATAIALATALLAAAPATAQLTETERSIVAAVEANHPDAVALLEQTVNINSGTLNAAGVRQVYDVLAPRFEALGFAVSYVENSAVANR